MDKLASFIADQDWGSKGASLLSARFLDAAASIRAKADYLAQEAERYGGELTLVAGNVRSAQAEGWEGLAAQAYEGRLQKLGAQGESLASEITGAAPLLRQAGEEMAGQLDSLGAQVQQLGLAFDRAVDFLAEGLEKADDAIEDLMKSPAALIQEEIDGFQNHPLLRFAESLS